MTLRKNIIKDLYNYLIENVSFVSMQEQKEFEKLDLDFETKVRS